MRWIISSKNPVCTHVARVRTRRDAVVIARTTRRVRGAQVRVIKLRLLKGGVAATA